ncbi:amino acid adenylation domain-containing protein [Curtobacterium sp. YC1]|uniref:non-ribosomal peptide synthetase family protein n=1 Tax=Curtobacterium sp. YC1 TaxID=2795488 RepID=UPI0018E500E6|nr:amino acid adenylation domain-containing protein [Curtobacterium sp. YC1]QQD76387.1 amino acid adenylation domain-containing protein [Curtobacterium sp. YC1]
METPTTFIAASRVATTMPTLLRTAAAAAPDHPAVVEGDATLTFSALWTDAVSQAAHLRSQGVRPGDSVGLFLEPGAALVTAVWGVLLAGAAYVPLAVDYPDERIRYMIGQSRLAHVIADERTAARVRQLTPDTVRVHHAGAAAVASSVGQDPDADGPAYVIFTSGSTGRPKGVVVPHVAITHQLRWLAGEMELGSARILLKTPTSFDAAQWELLANAVGATIVIGPAGVHRDPAAIAQLVDEQQVSHLQCVPTLWRALTREHTLSRNESLTHVFSGGEALTATDAQEILQVVPNATLVNLYGPTETTINATFHRVGPDDVRDARSVVSIGRPVPGCTVHVLDHDRRPVAPGDVGELAIGGPQVASGYENDPERTAERFIEIDVDGVPTRVYVTGDVVSRHPDGDLHFHGRVDDQVKINGHRVETEEVRLVIEQHHWVRSAAVVPWTDPRDGLERLAAFVELDPEEAAVMDADRAGQHHRSKSGHEQVRAQLAALERDGERTMPDDVALPGSDGTLEQQTTAFARKTYRFYDGAELHVDDVVAFIEASQPPSPTGPRVPLTIEALGELLRWFGPFRSIERLLPKYAYASPGALNATRLFVEVAGIDGIADGLHEYRPDPHALRAVTGTTGGVPRGTVRVHLVGDRGAIEAVYATNVDEVLHFEAGHMVGVLDHASARLGYFTHHRSVVQDPRLTGPDHVCTATIDLRDDAPAPDGVAVRTTVQLHRTVVDGRAGTYDVRSGRLEAVSGDVIERRHVIAINQETYDRSSFGVTMSVPEGAGWRGFVELGRSLQRLQMNSVNIGLMSAGYSSLTGRDLPSAVRYREIVGGNDLVYFAVAGPVSDEQIRSVGMREDSVHTRGPEEILRDDLRRTLPYYMVPARVTVIDEIPVSSSGKHDRAALISALERAAAPGGVSVPPANTAEERILDLWNEVLGAQHGSVEADFFDVGGNSLDAVRLINRINRELGGELPVQTVFDRPTVRALAAGLSGASTVSSRLIKLAEGPAEPLIIWPGLGGYPMNLRTLANQLSSRFTVYAVQTHGLNADEVPRATLREMIDDDVTLVQGAFADQDVTLAGYSFGARVATAVAASLLRAGRAVRQLVLIAPGSPFIPALPVAVGRQFDDPYFLRMAYSVFLGRLPDVGASTQLDAVTDERAFLAALATWRPELDSDLAARILRVASTTFGFRDDPAPDVSGLLADMRVFAATGDSPSFLRSHETVLEGTGQLSRLPVDHYTILGESTAATVAHLLADRQLQER